MSEQSSKTDSHKWTNRPCGRATPAISAALSSWELAVPFGFQKACADNGKGQAVQLSKASRASAILV